MHFKKMINSAPNVHMQMKAARSKEFGVIKTHFYNTLSRNTSMLSY